MLRPFRFAAAALAGVALAALAPAQRIAPAPAPLSGKEIFQRTLRSVAWIIQVAETGPRGARILTGSGSLIDVPGRIVLTNHHVVRDAKKVAVFFPQFDRSKQLITDKEHYIQQLRARREVLEGDVIATDPKRDLALIKLPKLPSGTTSVRMAKESVGPGDDVHSLGNPGASGALWAYTPGSVKQVYRKKWAVLDREERMEFNYDAQVVETTSPVNSGDSGGPLLNSSGELVAVTQGGVVSGQAQGTISFFIDISEVRNLLAAKKIRITNSPAPAAEATTVAAEIKADPKVEAKNAAAAAKAAAEAEADKLEKEADRKLTFAKDFIKDRPDKARERLEDIVKNYPKTRAAQEAKDLLPKLKK